MKENWRIRRATDSDAPALEKCMHAAYQPYTDRIDPAVLPPMNADYADEIRDSEVWIAESDAGLVGALILAPTDDRFQIANLAVHPNFQGNGLGRGLLEFAETEAVRQGHAEMCLATHSALGENISLYRHLGWAEVESGRSHVLMRKSSCKAG